MVTVWFGLRTKTTFSSGKDHALGKNNYVEVIYIYVNLCPESWSETGPQLKQVHCMTCPITQTTHSLYYCARRAQRTDTGRVTFTSSYEA